MENFKIPFFLDFYAGLWEIDPQIMEGNQFKNRIRFGRDIYPDIGHI